MVCVEWWGSFAALLRSKAKFQSSRGFGRLTVVVPLCVGEEPLALLLDARSRRGADRVALRRRDTVDKTVGRVLPRLPPIVAALPTAKSRVAEVVLPDPVRGQVGALVANAVTVLVVTEAAHIVTEPGAVRGHVLPPAPLGRRVPPCDHDAVDVRVVDAVRVARRLHAERVGGAHRVAADRASDRVVLVALGKKRPLLVDPLARAIHHRLPGDAVL